MTAHDRNMNLPVVQIADTQVQQIAYKGEPVVTFAMVDEIHQRADGTARRNFNDNRDRFHEGADFVTLNQPNEIRSLGFTRPQGGTPASVVLLTERGYLKLVKPMQDDRAWEVQGEMIDCYFKVKSAAPLAAPASSAVLSREVRLQTKMFAKLAKDMGLEGNQAILSVCRGVENMTGVNPMDAMGIKRLEAEQNCDLLNVTQLGNRLGVKAQEMNLKLIGKGLQTSYRDRKGALKYELTEEGRAHGGTWTDVQKAQGGRPIRQLVWPSRVADLFKTDHSGFLA